MVIRPDTHRPISPTGLVTLIGTVTALCIMGDSLMYSILPLEAVRLGFALPLVGVLLSANRFVRLLSNQWAGLAFNRFGAHWPFVASAVLGIISTFAYGLEFGFVVFLAARLAWGVSWSGLRQGGYVATWAGSSGIRGRLTGLLLGIVRLGSAVGVLLGGLLYDWFDFTTSVIGVAAIGLLAIPLALAIPWGASRSNNAAQDRLRDADSAASWRSMAGAALQLRADRWLSISGLVIYMVSGTVVSTTSIFVMSRLGGQTESIVFGLGVATLTGFFHGTRWTANLLVGPIVGALSDLIGKANTLALLGALMLAALFAVAALPPSIAIAAMFPVLILDGSLHVVVNATASDVSVQTAHPHAFVAAFSTASDAGSAFGPLIAFSALARTQLTVVYVAGGLVLFLSVLKFWSAVRHQALAAQSPVS